MIRNFKKSLLALLCTTSSAFAVDVNIRNFGAMPNDNNDDSSAIQRAIDSLKNGDRLLFPAGQYLIRQALYIDNLSNLNVEGNGATLKKSGGTEYIMRIYTNSKK